MESLPLWLVLAGMGALLLVLAAKVKSLLRWQRVLAELSTALVILSLPYLLLANLPLVATGFLIVLSIWLMLLAARLVFGRLDLLFLQSSTAYNIGIIAGLAAITLLWVAFLPSLTLYAVATALLVVSLLTGIFMLAQTAWTYRHYKIQEGPRLKESDLPTVSLCIPARNENLSLRECLNAAVASDYPKLEILVLDDCSQDKTSEVIREYAHAGVRFVKGSLPASGWLGRNQALGTLAEQATGEALIFMGVDTVLGPKSVSQLINYAYGRAEMVSVLPYSPQKLTLDTALATMRYYWQLVLPLSMQNVPTSSKFWLINAKALHKLGGFDSVKHKIIPELSFAKRLFPGNAYRFVVGDERLGMTTRKPWRDQLQTEIRTLYPTFKRQPMYTLAIMASMVGIYILPFALLLGCLLAWSINSLFWLSLAACALLFISRALVMMRLQPYSWLASTLLLPALYIQELVLITISMLAYEFSEVNWKGRNVCYPVISLGQRSVAAVHELRGKQGLPN